MPLSAAEAAPARCARVTSRSFALEVRLGRRRASGPDGVLLVAAAADSEAAAAWLDELHSLVREAAATFCPTLPLQALEMATAELENL